MNIALLLADLPENERKQLAKEFPSLLFLSYPRHPIQPVPKEQWQRTEIIYGERLTPEELAIAPQLRWIHCPSSHLNRLCLPDIEQRGNVLVSFTKVEQLFQIAEYLFSVVLAFAKNLFQWKDVYHFPNLVWDCKWRGKMMTLEKKIFLQVGLGSIGQALAKKAVESGMRVYGVDKTISFKPHCSKQFDYSQLEAVLPEADVVSIALPREQGLQAQFTKELIGKIKNDAILTILGSPRIVDEPALVEQASRFRGILIDAYYQNPIPPQSKLWTIPNLLITPEVAPRPKSETKEAPKTFRYNLRQYLHDNYSDMKNLVDPQVAYIPDTEIS